jgi:CxxC motif-containing protein (DUF1111 family)
LSLNEAALFNESLLRVSELEGTCNTCAQQPPNVLPIDPSPANPFSPTSLVNSAGMGPVFNADQCFICHSQPQIGGSSPKSNPAHVIATRLGGTNTVRSSKNRMEPFERCASNISTTECAMAVCTDYGLIESIQDRAIVANMNANRAAKSALGISGHANRVGNNGTVSRFGWKAQNASITMFAGEAYNVGMGISNDLFPASRSEDEDCNVAYEPFDVPRTEQALYDDPLKIMPAWLMFTMFMRFVDAPEPAPMSASAVRGKELFEAVGCALCHTPSFKTPGQASPQTPAQEIGPKVVTLRGRTVNLYSDLLVHHMGATLADNIVQGNAGPDEFRTTPLWGLGQRLFLLHDGRTDNLLVAINDHFSASHSRGGDNPARDSAAENYEPSVANAVVRRFDALANADKQAVLDFLRSL